MKDITYDMMASGGNSMAGEIEAKYLRGGALSEEQRQLAVATLTSDDLRKRIISAGAILRDESSPPDMRAVALSHLEDVCTRCVIEGLDSCKSEMLVALMVIPGIELLRSRILKEFAYSSASAVVISLRANAMVALGRLGVLGDERAITLLRQRLKDSNSSVSKNAKIAMANISQGRLPTYKIEDCGNNK